MKARTWMVAGLVMVLLGVWTTAAAGTGEGEQNGPPNKGKKGDGKAGREEMLKKYDANGDGQLDESERAALRQEMEARGGGSRGDRPGREEMLKKYDANGDGQLDESERAALRQEMEARGGGPQGDRPGREEMLKKYDTNGDGELSEEERTVMRNDRQQNRKQDSASQ